MARFSQIDNKAMTGLEFKVVEDFFIDHIFFKFMSQGRNGITSAVHDLVDTVLGYQVENQPHIKSSFHDVLTAKQYEEIVSRLTRKLINDFINHGTGRISETVQLASMLIAEKVTKLL